jgi:SAM-dependent methyltransferase
MPAQGSIIAGADYVKQITKSHSDLRARAAFQALAISIAPRPGRVLDFGCGPGIDARFYAERGLNVTAFDIDPQMCEFFANHCRDYIGAKQIELHCGPYKDFIENETIGAAGGFDLITSNFAPLNLVDDLPALFTKLHALTNPNGRVLVSVLNPYYFGDLRYRWWWRNLARLWRDGQFFVQGAQARITRRLPARFAACAGPYFGMRNVTRGFPLSGRFMFLLFDRRQL